MLGLRHPELLGIVVVLVIAVVAPPGLVAYLERLAVAPGLGPHTLEHGACRVRLLCVLGHDRLVDLLKGRKIEALPADALNRTCRNDLIVRVAIKKDLSSVVPVLGWVFRRIDPEGTQLPQRLPAFLVLQAEPGIDLFALLLRRGPCLDQCDEIRQCLDARLGRHSALLASVAALTPVHDLVHEVDPGRIGRVAHDIGVGNGLATSLLVVAPQERSAQRHHVALTVADHGDRAIGLCLANGLDEFLQPMRRMREVGARRRCVDLAPFDGQHVGVDPPERAVVQPQPPHVGQGGRAVLKRATAPGVELVEKDALLPILGVVLFVGAVFRRSLKAPAKTDHRRTSLAAFVDVRLRAETLVQPAIGLNLGLVSHGRQRRAGSGAVDPTQALHQALAQPRLGLLVPLARGIHAVHEDDHARNR
ncbi:hypothetical protein D9M72_356380 [compost metagenome]